MSELTVAIPAELQDWVEQQIVSGRHVSVEDYLEALIRRDKDENDEDAVARLNAALEIGRRSGVSTRTLDDIIRGHMSARNAA